MARLPNLAIQKRTFARTQSATILASSATSAVWSTAKVLTILRFDDFDRIIDLDAHRLKRCRRRVVPRGYPPARRRPVLSAVEPAELHLRQFAI
jgi:hypothetical protein